MFLETAADVCSGIEVLETAPMKFGKVPPPNSLKRSGAGCVRANRAEITPLLMGVSIVILAFNLLVDIAYGFVDPRVRY